MLTLKHHMHRLTRQQITRVRTTYKMLRFSAFATVLALLFGCDSGSEAVDAAGKTVNSFARNAVDANEEIAQNGVSDITACTGTDPSAVTYCLVVEATDTMIASWQSDLFNLITPAKAYAFRGLTTVPARSIEIIQVDENLNRVSNASIPSYTVTENPSLGTYSINFSESPPARIDIIAKVTLENGQVMLAPFIDSSIDENFNPIVVVNVVSDFLVKRLFGKLETAEALNNLLPCNDGGSDFGNNIDCKSQPFAKFSLWNAVNGLTQSYEIDIPADYTIAQALVLLDETSEFKMHIDTILDEILRTEEAFVGGTERFLDLTDPQNNYENLTVQKAYNSSLFSLAFNQTNPETTSKGASISTTLSSDFLEDAGAVSYPELIRSTSNFYVTLTSLTENFPIQRTTLAFSQANDLSLSDVIDNSLSSASSNTFLTSQGFYVAGRVPFQTITDNITTTAVGWQSDPYTQLIYSPDADGSGSQSMLSSFVRNGSRYAISANADSTWARNNKQEEQNIFAWNIYNQVPEDADGKPIEVANHPNSFTTTAINLNEYGAVGLSMKLSDTGNILTATGKTIHWNAISTSAIAESQPSLPAMHYQTYSFSRAESQDLTVSGPSSIVGSANRQYEATPSTKSTDKGLQQIDLGRLAVSAFGNSTELNQASATPTGDMITVTQNESTAGQGMIQAMELRNTAFVADRVLTYRLSGNSFGADATNNILRNYNNSIITLTPPNSATLTFNTLESTHDVSTQAVSKITATGIANASGTFTVDTKGETQISLSNVEGFDLKLNGFMSQHLDASGSETSQAGNVLTLLMVHGFDGSNNQATLGLIQAFKEQALDVEIK